RNPGMSEFEQAEEAERYRRSLPAGARARPTSERNDAAVHAVALGRAASRASALGLQRSVGNRAATRVLQGNGAGRRPGSLVQRVGSVITALPDAGTSEHPTIAKGRTNNAAAV